nr:glycosyltransferase [Cytophagales bacterium]
MRKAAIVILNYNGKGMLERFLPSVVQNSIYDIVIVDNASTDDSMAYLSRNFPHIHTILLSDNFGYSGGYNMGLEELRGKYVYYILLNSDVSVEKGWDLEMVDFLDRAPHLAVAQPKILSLVDAGTFDYAGAAGGFLDALGYPYCRGRILHSIEIDQGQYDLSVPVEWASGACFCIRAKLFHTYEGFDPLFFAHMEEIDLCWRLRKQGYSIGVNPSVAVYHLGGGTLQRSNPRKTFLNFRNSLFMLYKNLPAGKFLQLLFWRLLLDTAASFHLLLTSGPGHTIAVFRAYLYFFKMRKELQRDASTGGIGVGMKTNTIISIIWTYYFKRKKYFSQLP